MLIILPLFGQIYTLITLTYCLWIYK